MFNEFATGFKLFGKGRLHTNGTNVRVKVVAVFGVKHDGVVSKALQHDILEFLGEEKGLDVGNCAGGGRFMEVRGDGSRRQALYWDLQQAQLNE